ncbi:MAG TPA: hypothetical protein VHX19_20820, partial [Stellaceae bacterium]|nr:hypothetical protein [Stellaceae bacterium]
MVATVTVVLFMLVACEATHAQVVITGNQTTTQSLAGLAGASGTTDAVVSSGASIDVVGANGLVSGGTHSWNVTNNGTIIGFAAVGLFSGGNVTNTGTIATNATNGIGATGDAIGILYGNPIIDNSGTITNTSPFGPRAGIELAGISGASITNRVGATIDISGSYPTSSGILVDSSSGTVVIDNAGTINAGQAISNLGANSVVKNEATGTISGFVTLFSGSVQNAGLITGAVQATGGATVANTGVITAMTGLPVGFGAVDFFGAYNGTLVNGGTIGNINGPAVVFFNSGDSTLV